MSVRAGPRIAVVVLLCTLALGGASGCSDCDVSCDRPQQELTFTGELLAVDGSSTTWDGPDGAVDIVVYENADFLDPGDRYRVAAVKGTGSLVWETAVNGSCTCAGGVRHEDGATIDTGWWAGFNRTYPVTEAVWLFLAVPIVTIVAVTVLRIRRGADHDPWHDLPDDGSWLEYADPEDVFDDGGV